MEAPFQDHQEEGSDQQPIPEESQFTLEYLIFAVGGCHCALPVLQVKEVVEKVIVTPVPNVSSSIAGVMNLRGLVVPVLNLRTILNLPEGKENHQQALILRRDPLVGLLVTEVFQIKPFLKGLLLPVSNKKTYGGVACFQVEEPGAPPIILLDANLLFERKDLFLTPQNKQ